MMMYNDIQLSKNPFRIFFISFATQLEYKS